MQSDGNTLYTLVRGATDALIQEISDSGVEIDPNIQPEFSRHLTMLTVEGIQIFLIGTRSGMATTKKTFDDILRRMGNNEL